MSDRSTRQMGEPARFESRPVSNGIIQRAGLVVHAPGRPEPYLAKVHISSQLTGRLVFRQTALFFVQYVTRSGRG